MNQIITSIIPYLSKLKIQISINKKLNKIYSNTNNYSTDEMIERKYKELWSQFRCRPSLKFLRSMIAISGISSYEYVPETIQYTILEPVLNNRTYAFAYNDKNFFERYLGNFADLFPKTIFRVQYGSFYDEKYNRIDNDLCVKKLMELPLDEDLILKPSIETGGGSNVILIKHINDKYEVQKQIFTAKEILSFMKDYNYGNCILQERLKQHQWFEQFNITSLNTLRLYVYRSVQDDMVHPLSAYIRFGRKGSLVDNSSQGGFTMGVNLSGLTNNFYITRYGKKITEDEILKMTSQKFVPNFQEFISYAENIAPYFLHHRLLGFDFTVDSNGRTRLLEINNLYIGIINQQMNNGALYGPYLYEILDYGKQHYKSYSYHFYKR